MSREHHHTQENAARSAKPQKGMAMEGPVAAWYARVRRVDPRREALCRRLGEVVPAGGCILEVAPGPGYLAIELAKLGIFQVVGLDSSRSFVGIAQREAEEAGAAVEFHQGNASDLPFEDDAFDFIVCVAAFKNFAEPVRAIAEMHRVLVPGGKALINDLRGDASAADIRAEVEGMDLNPLNKRVVQWTLKSFLLKRAYTQADIQRFVAQTSFGSATIQQDNAGMDIWLEKQLQ